ncbi:MAG: hypothetical protein KC444_06295 [Nitrosopumilus sp.]|nr:hypothetical protein [Nitrosopumilus sp.]
MNYLDERSQIFEMIAAFDHFYNRLLMCVGLKNEYVELEFKILEVKALAKELDADD